ncbi:hypothetical protein Tco_1108836 [Tanacetum coccineum]
MSYFLKIESLKVNSTLDRVLESPSSFPIFVADSDSFLEESDTSFSHLDNSLPEFETFSDHTEETRSGSTTTHANYSLPDLMMTKGEVRLIFLKMTIPSHLLSGLFSHFSPTLRFLFYLAPPGVKIRSLTPASPLRAGGISSGWNFHDYQILQDSRCYFGKAKKSVKLMMEKLFRMELELMLRSGINLLLLVKVNAARHKLITAGES